MLPSLSEYQAKQAAASHERTLAMNVAGMAAGYADAPRDLSPMEQAMNGVDGAIGALADTLDRLESRLSPVMRPPMAMPGQTSGGPSPVPQPCGMAVEQSRTQRNRVDHLNARVLELLSRLDC